MGVLALQADFEVLEAIASRDGAALERLYQRYAPELLAMAKRVVGDSTRAERLVVELFVELWRTPALFAASIPLRAQLFASIRERAMKSQAAAGHQRCALQKTADDRVLLELCYFGGWSLNEIAEAWGDSRRELSQRVAKALTLLARTPEGRA